jgi:hypothetical protein
MNASGNFDASRAEAARDHAIERVERHANELWKEAALSAGYRVCREQPLFTADDIWRILDTYEESAWTHEPRAMGAILRQMALDGACEVTGRHIKSVRVSTHRRPLAEWKSLVYDTSRNA